MPCVTMTSSRGVGYSILGGGLSLATEGVGQGRDGARVFRVRGGGGVGGQGGTRVTSGSAEVKGGEERGDQLR